MSPLNPDSPPPRATAASTWRNLDDASWLFWCPDFLTQPEAQHLFDVFAEALPWRQDALTLFGRKVLQPRLVAYLGDPDAHYTYSGLTLSPEAWHPLAASLRTRLDDFCQTRFNSVLCNFYRNGQDSMGWHSDDERTLGVNPIIASLSLGTPRRFVLRTRTPPLRKEEMLLTPGSLLVMGGALQHRWQHALPKTARPIGGRINLTFRSLQTGHLGC